MCIVANARLHACPHVCILCINMLCIAFASNPLVVCTSHEHGHRLSHVARLSLCVTNGELAMQLDAVCVVHLCVCVVLLSNTLADEQPPVL